MEGHRRILHVIERLAPGGAAGALIAAARRLAGSGQRHEILSLEAPVEATAKQAEQAGLSVIDGRAPDVAAGERWRSLMAEADLVWVHAWTSPALDAFLRRPHPPARWLVWLHVAGDTAPHVLTAALADFPDLLVASCPYSLSLPAFAEARCETSVVLSGSDLAPFAAIVRQPGPSFRVGYVGTLDATKMHPDFVQLSAAAAIPEARFDVFGRGAGEQRLRREIALHGDGRFQLHGWASDVPSALSAMDVFGYPLARDCHASAELVLQEAMAAGVPPVILDRGAAVHLVDHGRTGLIARDEADYPRRLEQLAADPALRHALGDAARRHALAKFGADRAAAEFDRLISRLMQRPKKQRAWRGHEATGAERLIAALGAAGAPLVASRTVVDDAASRCADEEIAAAVPALASATSGGILHWRRAYPDDPWLRFWSGLMLLGQGRRVPATGEFLRARALGLPASRLGRYVAEDARGARPVCAE